MDNLITILMQVTVLLFSVIVHEVSHGLVAYKLGDPTAKLTGRLTLNPAPHIDPFMSVILPFFLIFTHSPFIIGGAKPVPINPNNFLKPKRDIMLVSLAGPGSNIILAIVSAFLLKLSYLNILPFLNSNSGFSIFFKYGLIINLILAAFNLIPIPPLDGSKILMFFLPDRLAYSYMRIEPYGVFIIIILLAFNLLQYFLYPIFFILSFIIKIVTGG